MLALFTSVVALFDLSIADTSIRGQVFCDNYCTIYFNGEVVHDDQSWQRTVDEFVIKNVEKKGKRTFAVMLKDSPWNREAAVWQIEPAAFLQGQTDANGNAIVRQYCLGNGVFRAIFEDDKCGEVVVTSDEWKCETVVHGPRDIEACFPNWQTDVIHPTYGGPNDEYTLPCYCIRSSDASFAPDFSSCDCTKDLNEDYVNWADKWFLPGFDDSAWMAAATYTEQEAVPGQARGILELPTECNKPGYCYFPSSTWRDSQFIWAPDRNLDKVVVCRFEYDSDC